MKFFVTSLFAIASFPLIAQTPCINGMAGGYPCNQVSLQAHVTLAEMDAHALNDIWGWTDPVTGKEYALVGLTEGVSFVDVTIPTAPVVIGKLGETHSHGRAFHGESSWRDIKVYQDHAFIISDVNEAHGMQVFDLTRLRGFDGSPAESFEHDAVYDGVGSSHNIVINEETGYAYIVGVSSGASTCGAGGLHILNIQDPKNPVYEACFDDDGYTHDAQCVVYNGSDTDYQGQEICFNSNEDTFTIVNVDDKNEMNMVSRTTYENVQYTHQGWLTEDHQYYLMNDELDESQFGFNPRTLIWDVRDLDNPIMIGEFYNEAAGIDHNLYTKDNLVYESNYTSGLRVLSSARLDEGIMREVAFFDTEPANNSVVFEGAWSSYPYFESGNIIVSDMLNGLFILKLELTERITEHPVNVQACEGSANSISIGTSGSGLTFQWQIEDDNDFVDLTDDENFSGTQTNNLNFTFSTDLDARSIRARVTADEGSQYLSFPSALVLDTIPTADFEIIIEGGTVTFEPLAENSDTYHWDFGDGATSEEVNPTHTYAATQSYTVTLTVTNDCGSRFLEQTILVVTSALDPYYFLTYPNPVVERLTIESSGASTFELFDLSGKRLQAGVVKDQLLHVDFSAYKSGSYILVLDAKGKKLTQRIVKR